MAKVQILFSIQLGDKISNNNFKMINILGQIILFGYAAGFPESLWNRNTFEYLFFNGIAIRPFSLLSIMLGEPKLLKISLQKLFDLLQKNVIKPEISKIYALEEADKAHQLIKEKNKGKLLLKPVSN